MGTAVNNAGVSEIPAVAVRDLWVTYPGTLGTKVHVLERVSLDVWPGEFVCFVGPSGCGKTTLLNVIGGFLKPTKGDVFAQGELIQGPDPRRIFIFQEGGVFPWLTVRDNVGFSLGSLDSSEKHRLVDHYIELVGLTGFDRTYPKALSGGMRQRVEIARALVARPETIYMDEPFGALDFFTRLKMRGDLIRIWEQERKTILFVTHDIDEAIQLADRVIVLSKRPATIQTIVPIDIPRPRDPNGTEYLAIREHIVASLGISLQTGLEVKNKP
jgi:NitT/TauT family transport system ATP-binding protein